MCMYIPTSARECYCVENGLKTTWKNMKFSVCYCNSAIIMCVCVCAYVRKCHG